MEDNYREGNQFWRGMRMESILKSDAEWKAACMEADRTSTTMWNKNVRPGKKMGTILKLWNSESKDLIVL